MDDKLINEKCFFQVAKLKRDVDAGLSVVVFADWYNVSVMKKASLDGCRLREKKIHATLCPLIDTSD